MKLDRMIGILSILLPGIVDWIASFGEGAELLEPEEFRKDVLAFAEGIRRKYLG